MDRALSDIVDQCLTVDPQQRFSGPHSVLEALRSREQARTRRPLVMLGFVGPALLLLIMALFGWRGYLEAVGGSEEHLTDRVRKSNEFAAKFVAEVVANELGQYRRAVETVIADEQFQSLLRDVLDNQQLMAMLEEMDQVQLTLAQAQRTGDPYEASDEKDSIRRAEASRFGELLDKFRDHPARQPLAEYVTRLMVHEKTPRAASWFVTNDTGIFLAAAFKSPPERSPVGRNYSWRTYFHGGANDLPPWQRVDQHIAQTHLSAVFRSEATNTWKVAISAPVGQGQKALGLVALTIELGNFMTFPGSETQFAVLVDARDGQNKGVILEHPLFTQVLSEASALPPHFSQYRVDVHQWAEASVCPYLDPLGRDDRGKAYQRPWVAAKAPVQLAEAAQVNGDVRLHDTGWFVLVQEDLGAAVQPVVLLGRRLAGEGLTALAVVIAVVVVLWYLVLRLLAKPSQRIQRSVVAPSAPTPLHSRETLELPASDRRR
jgi:hypothetical protein